MATDPFDALMRSLDAPMVVVTAALDDEQAGCLVGFHAQSSIHPGRYCLWISKANHTYRVMLQTTHLGIHFLTVDDVGLAQLFGSLTGDEVDKFERCRSSTGSHGVPVLDECANRMVVRRAALLDDGGDHVCVVCEPIEATSAGPFTPLRLAAVADLSPGHEVDDRPEPPTERAAT